MLVYQALFLTYFLSNKTVLVEFWLRLRVVSVYHYTFFFLGFNPACLNEAVELGYKPLPLSRGSYLLALPLPEAGCVQSGRIPYLSTRQKAFTTIVLSICYSVGLSGNQTRDLSVPSLSD